MFLNVLIFVSIAAAIGCGIYEARKDRKALARLLLSWFLLLLFLAFLQFVMFDTNVKP